MASHQLWSEAFLHARCYMLLVLAALSISNLPLRHIIHGSKVEKHQLLVYAFSGGVDKILIKRWN